MTEKEKKKAGVEQKLPDGKTLKSFSVWKSAPIYWSKEQDEVDD